MEHRAEIHDGEPVLDSEVWLDQWTRHPGYSRFALGAWVMEERERRGHTHHFDPKVPLDSETFDRYYQSTIPYRRMTERRAYQLLQRASRRLHATVQLHSNLHKHGGRLHESLDGHHAALSVTGAVTDWLSYSYIYLDTEETFCKRLGQEEFDHFKQATHDAYDAFPAYRFLYQVRNYAHHYGPPLAALDLSASDDSWEIDVMVDKRQLLADRSFHWNERSREVLDGLPERFAIVPLITEAMEGYRLIERRMLSMYLDYVESWLGESYEMLDALGDHGGVPCLLAIPPDETKSMQVLGSIGVQPIMNRDALDRVEWSLEQPDPVGAMSIDHHAGLGFVPDRLATLKATQVMAAFFHGDAPTASSRIRDILATDKGDPNQLIGGLVNQLAVNLHMLSGLLGISPEQLLNTDWTDDDLEE